MFPHVPPIHGIPAASGRCPVAPLPGKGLIGEMVAIKMTRDKDMWHVARSPTATVYPHAGWARLGQKGIVGCTPDPLTLDHRGNRTNSNQINGTGETCTAIARRIDEPEPTRR
jgi:hypothetical protein